MTFQDGARSIGCRPGVSIRVQPRGPFRRPQGNSRAGLTVMSVAAGSRPSPDRAPHRTTAPQPACERVRRAACPSHQEASHPLDLSHRGGRGRPHPDRTRPLSTELAARVRAAGRRSTLRLDRRRVRRAGLTRQTRVGMGPVRVQPGRPQLQLHRDELLRDPAGLPVPGSVARPARLDMARAGRLAPRVHPRPVRLTFDGVGGVARPVAPLVLR